MISFAFRSIFPSYSEVKQLIAYGRPTWLTSSRKTAEDSKSIAQTRMSINTNLATTDASREARLHTEINSWRLFSFSSNASLSGNQPREDANAEPLFSGCILLRVTRQVLLLYRIHSRRPTRHSFQERLGVREREGLRHVSYRKALYSATRSLRTTA